MENSTENISSNENTDSKLRLLSLNEVRKILGIGYKAATKLIADGELHAIRINSRYKIPQLSLYNYINIIASYKIDENQKGQKNIDENTIEGILEDLHKKYLKTN